MQASKKFAYIQSKEKHNNKHEKSFQERGEMMIIIWKDGGNNAGISKSMIKIKLMTF